MSCDARLINRPQSCPPKSCLFAVFTDYTIQLLKDYDKPLRDESVVTLDSG